MSHTRAEYLASQIDACMTGGKLFTRKMMEQTRDELRRLDAENEPLRLARPAAKGSKPRARGTD
ncbi:hypothetical protein TW83_07795 [Paracoccus sp. S4493]|uniref:hypothetical protein n=1 Tax=Paracoccus sp. S4493 TaxID=579490 RepID=UPI0005F9B8BB|nr:hypothetical protein [Paracoccus sp. S4493]KJZ31653.1 hypothetical protein TW83_07795 [Paracoccus sp. S4493]